MQDVSCLLPLTGILDTLAVSVFVYFERLEVHRLC